MNSNLLWLNENVHQILTAIYFRVKVVEQKCTHTCEFTLVMKGTIVLWSNNLFSRLPRNIYASVDCLNGLPSESNFETLYTIYQESIVRLHTEYLSRKNCCHSSVKFECYRIPKKVAENNPETIGYLFRAEEPRRCGRHNEGCY